MPQENIDSRSEYEKYKDEEINKLSRLLKNLQVILGIGATIVSILIYFLTATFVSKDDFQSYKEQELRNSFYYTERNAEMIAKTLEKSLAPIIEDNMKISSDLTSLRAEISAIKSDLAKINYIVSNGIFATADTFNEHRNQSSIDTQKLKGKIEEIENNLKRLEKEISSLIKAGKTY